MSNLNRERKVLKRTVLSLNRKWDGMPCYQRPMGGPPSRHSRLL